MDKCLWPVILPLVLYRVALDLWAAKLTIAMRQAYQDKWKYGRCISAIWWVTWRAFTWFQRGGESANHFFTEISRDFACLKKVCFNKFRLFPGSFTRHIATISLKDWSHMEIMQLEYYSIRETLKDGNHQSTYLLNMNTLKTYKITNKYTKDKPEKKKKISNKNIFK